MNSRRSNVSMTNSEYRIDLNCSTNVEQMESVEEEIVDQIQMTTTPPNPIQQNAPATDFNNDHFHQIIAFLKDNLTSTFPFALILIVKAFYEHSAGILIVIFFSASIYHANTVLVHQASLKSYRQIFPIGRVIVILSLSLIVFLYLFRRDQFYFSLIFARPNSNNFDLGTFLWILYSTFCIVKMSIMILKGLLILYPLSSSNGKYCLKSRQRGSYFALIEYLSQFYISLLTIRPWIHFLWDRNETNLFFSSFLIISYGIVKIFNLCKSLMMLRRSLKETCKTLPFPSASLNDLRDNSCPICQSEYEDPIILTCEHVFCEECVSSWLDRNASCPLCRLKLPIGQTNYRDGFTSGYLIWY